MSSLGSSVEKPVDYAEYPEHDGDHRFLGHSSFKKS